MNRRNMLRHTPIRARRAKKRKRVSLGVSITMKETVLAGPPSPYTTLDRTGPDLSDIDTTNPEI